MMACKLIPYRDWSKELDHLLAKQKAALINDPEFMDHAFDPEEEPNRPITHQDKFALLVGEAAKTMQMIEPYIKPGMRLLEIGGGVGLTYATLQTQGYDIVSLEPGADGFGDRHRAGLRLLALLKVDPAGWLRTGIEDYPQKWGEAQFDLIFSFFVLEHIPDLEQAFRNMATLLNANGIMVHCCPNYTIPFEPHYNIPLVPLKPAWTSLFFPYLKNKGLWRGLCFTTQKSITRICDKVGMVPSFRKGMTAMALERILTDPVFAARKTGFFVLARLMKSSGLLKVLKLSPSILNTPMEFYARKAGRL
jgi:cyclopropane fatty-acyl-phospholipid synthase-like methyltransferase